MLFHNPAKMESAVIHIQTNINWFAIAIDSAKDVDTYKESTYTGHYLVIYNYSNRMIVKTKIKACPIFPSNP
jgi:hypothetical protein